MMRVAIINDTRPTNHYGCMLVMENLTSLLEQQGVEIAWTWPVGVDWRKHKRQIKNQLKVDAIIVNGEGTIHHSDDRKHARALSEFANYAKKELCTPCYLINATLHKNSAEAYKNLKTYKLIYVRDKGSLDELQSFGLQGQYVPDLTFAKAASYTYEPSKPACVIDTALKSEIPLLKQYCKEHEFDFRSMVVARPSNANFFKSPRPFVKNIIKWIKEDRKVSTQPSAFIRYLAEHEIVITGRYHTVSMCLKNKIPFVAIESNTPKISFLLDDALKNRSRVISFSELSQLDLQTYAHYTQEELEHLLAFIVRAEREIEQMVMTIIKDIQEDRIGVNGY
ncbi:MAG: polysaccharide pyruvyl transferase family protein [Pseudomonadota bacterium]|nr:polysaccharide pyruvyl transferase family protein [Pseudomonadota bacterium]